MKLVKFLPNRVWRVYLGGACLDAWRDVPEPRDGSFPEEWIASTVPAMNSQHDVPGEGLSQALLPDGTAISLADLLAQDGETWLGREHLERHGCVPGFLTKLLDSAIRLPLQAHPDVPTSRWLFHSEHGKTEAWVVLGGRRCQGEEPYLLMGFNDKLDEKVFREEALAGDMPRSVNMLHKVPVVPGDVILIPGGLPHAIGPGVLLQEIMEPSDWVVQPENYCGDCALTVQDRFCGADPAAALDAFHYEPLAPEALSQKVRQTPAVLQNDADARLSRLLDPAKTGFFGELELVLHGTWRRPEDMAMFMAGTVLEGQAVITADGETLPVAKGDTFAVACAADAVFHGEARILLAHR